jgi:hypothetical protein
MKANIFKQKVNFYISTCFILVFGLFMSNKIIDLLHLLNPAVQNPITDSVAATQAALMGN